MAVTSQPRGFLLLVFVFLANLDCVRWVICYNSGPDISLKVFRGSNSRTSQECGADAPLDGYGEGIATDLGHTDWGMTSL
jgi:hypothetical protein